MQMHFKPTWLLRSSALALLISTAFAATLLFYQWVDQKQCFVQRLLQLSSPFSLPSTSQEYTLTQGTLRLEQLARMPDGRKVKLVWSYRNTSSHLIEIGTTDFFFPRSGLASEPKAMLVDLQTRKSYFPALVAGASIGRPVPRGLILEPGEQYAAWTYFSDIPPGSHFFDLIVSGAHGPFHCVSDDSSP